MSKKKLLVIAGAGASVEFGMPSVSDVGGWLSAKASEWFPLADHPDQNLYDWLAEQVKSYWATVTKPGLARSPHFEHMLYVLFILNSAYPHGLFTSPLGALVRAIDFPDVNFLGRKREKVDEKILGPLASICADTIVDGFRERCRDVGATHATSLMELSSFLSALASEFELAVVTLNYDDLIWRSLPAINTGFDTNGRFNEGLLLGRSEWPCILHLHGSVHFDMQMSGTDLHAIHWQDNLNGTFRQNSFGRSSVWSDEGTSFPQSAIVAGFGKTSQILRRPFRTYYSELDRLVLSSDCLLCIGYGFGDEHLNSALETYRDHRHRPVALIDFAYDCNMTAAHANWDVPHRSVLDALGTLQTSPFDMSALGAKHSTTVAAVKAAKAFDLCTNPRTPLAIWYNGMLDACRNADCVLARLR